MTWKILRPDDARCFILVTACVRRIRVAISTTTSSRENLPLVLLLTTTISWRNRTQTVTVASSVQLNSPLEVINVDCQFRIQFPHGSFLDGDRVSSNNLLGTSTLTSSNNSRPSYWFSSVNSWGSTSSTFSYATLTSSFISSAIVLIVSMAKLCVWFRVRAYLFSL